MDGCVWGLGVRAHLCQVLLEHVPSLDLKEHLTILRIFCKPPGDRQPGQKALEGFGEVQMTAEIRALIESVIGSIVYKDLSGLSLTEVGVVLECLSLINHRNTSLLGTLATIINAHGDELLASMTSRSEQSTRLWISIGRTFGNLEYWDTNVMNLLATYLTNEQAVNALDLMQVVTLTAGLFKIRFVDQGAFEGIGRRTLDILKDRASKNDFPLNHAARWKSTLQIVSTLVHANVTYAPLMDYLYDRVLEGAQNGQLESAMSGEGIANQYLATELKRAFSHLLWCFTVTQHHLLPDFHHILRVVLKCYDFRQDSNVYRKLFQTVDAFQHESLPSLPTTTPHLDDLTAMCDAVITWPEGPQNLNKGFGEDYAFRRNWAHDTSEILDRLGVSHEVFYRSPDLPHVVDLAVVTQPPPPPTPAPAPDAADETAAASPSPDASSSSADASGAKAALVFVEKKRLLRGRDGIHSRPSALALEWVRSLERRGWNVGMIIETEWSRQRPQKNERIIVEKLAGLGIHVRGSSSYHTHNQHQPPPPPSDFTAGSDPFAS